jgi:hypothetical protein
VEGLAEYDFDSVMSTTGARPTGYERPLGGGGGGGSGNAFSTACSSSLVVPEFFETNLLDIEAVGASEVRFDTYVVVSVPSGLAYWARGPVAAISCIIVALLCALVFRRALGRRRTSALDSHDEKSAKGRVASGGGVGNIMHLFDKRAGTSRDDGSVDSDFYSDEEDEDDGDDVDGKAKKGGRVHRKKKDAKGNKGASSNPSSDFLSAPPSSKYASDTHKSFRGIRRTDAGKSFKGKRRASYDAAGLDSKSVGRSSSKGGLENNPSDDARRSKSTKKLLTSIVTDGRSVPSDEGSRDANEKRRSKTDDAMKKKERSQKAGRVV